MLSLLPTFFALASSVMLYFGQSQSSFPVGEEFSLPIYVFSSNQETIGTDISFTYDPKLLSVERIIPGQLYPFYPNNLFDLDNNHGKVVFSGTVGFGAPLSVNGVLAQVVFKGKQAGQTRVDFAWREKSTQDSHIVPLFGPLDLLSQKPEGITVSLRESESGEKVFLWLRNLLSFNYLRFLF